MRQGGMRRRAAGVLAAAGALLLSGCFVTPGAFDSELVLTKDGAIGFTYDGEVRVAMLAELADLGTAVDQPFEAAPCYDEEDFAEKPCSAEELARQREDWAAADAERADKRRRDAEMAKAVLGGIDPASPEAGAEIAQRLERQRGWERVRYLGQGVFEVHYALKGRLTHDFAFPVLERMPSGQGFVAVVLRDGNQVRVDAPGFLVMDPTNPTRGVLAAMMGMSAGGEGADDEPSEAAAPARALVPQGSFRLVTDGAILANNTDEGAVPAATGGRKTLTWKIDGQTAQAPMALLDLTP